MGSNYWIKLYHEILRDPKMARLSDRMWRRTIESFLLAGDYDEGGYLPPLDEASFILRCEEEILEAELNDLAKAGIVGMDESGWYVVNYAARQGAMSNSERAKRWRARNKHKYWMAKIYRPLPASPGVYRIFCKETGRAYVGASQNIRKRIKEHLRDMSNFEHALADDLAEYGAESIRVEVLEEVEHTKVLHKREKHWIQKIGLENLENKGINGANAWWTDPDRIMNEEDRPANEDRTIRSTEIESESETDTEAEEDKEQQQELAAVLISEENCSKARAEEIERWALYGERIGRVESPAAWARAAARDNFTQPHWFDAKQLEGQARTLYTGGQYADAIEH